MKHLPKNTLAYFNAAPQMKRFDLSSLPTATFATATKEYRKTCGEVSPNDAAVSFYTLNHLAALVKKSFTPNEPLPTWALTVMQQYSALTVEQGERMLHYILSIITREMRHLNGNQSVPTFNKIKAASSEVMVGYVKAIAAISSENLAVKHYMENPPNATIAQYTKGLAAAFHQGHWPSAGYGGPKWGVIADAATELVNGNTSLELLVDNGYALAHNGGPIFNKSMMFTHQNDEALLVALDVQRSGQMPDLMLTAQSYNVMQPSQAQAMVQLVQNALPVKDRFKGWVDWTLVDAMRPDKEHSPNKYKQHILKQVQAHGPAAAAVPPVPPKPKTLVIGGKTVTVTGQWQVGPNETVETYVRSGS